MQSTHPGFFPVAEKKQESSHDKPIKQLFSKSCAAFSCGLAFANVLKESKSLISHSKAVRVFELMIYPRIWMSPDGRADIQRSLNYLRQYVSDDLDFISTIDALSLMKPDGSIYFAIIDQDDDFYSRRETLWRSINALEFSHVFLINEKDDGYSCNGERAKHLNEIVGPLGKLVYLIKINKNDLSRDKIIKSYHAHLKYIYDLVKNDNCSESELVVKQYIVAGLLLSIEYFPELKPDVIRFAIANAEHCFKSVDHLIHAARYFPGYIAQLNTILTARYDDFVSPYKLDIDLVKKLADFFPYAKDKLGKMISQIDSPDTPTIPFLPQ